MAGLWILLFVTGNRLRETRKAEWAWVSDRDSYMVLPKTVTKNARDHLVPLVPTAVKVLEELKALETRARDHQEAKGRPQRIHRRTCCPVPAAFRCTGRRNRRSACGQSRVCRMPGFTTSAGRSRPASPSSASRRRSSSAC